MKLAYSQYTLMFVIHWLDALPDTVSYFILWTSWLLMTQLHQKWKNTRTILHNNTDWTEE